MRSIKNSLTVSKNIKKNPAPLAQTLKTRIRNNKKTSNQNKEPYSVSDAVVITTYLTVIANAATPINTIKFVIQDWKLLGSVTDREGF